VPRVFVLIDVGLSDHVDDKRVSKRGSAMQTVEGGGEGLDGVLMLGPDRRVQDSNLVTVPT
jgi:hypothetical protein